MSAAAALKVLSADGINLRVDPDGRLLANPADRLTTAHRDMVRAYRPALVALLTPQRLWLIRHPDGSVVSHAFSPPATRAEVEAWYPGAKTEPESEAIAGPVTAPPTSEFSSCGISLESCKMECEK